MRHYADYSYVPHLDQTPVLADRSIMRYVSAGYSPDLVRGTGRLSW